MRKDNETAYVFLKASRLWTTVGFFIVLSLLNIEPSFGLAPSSPSVGVCVEFNREEWKEAGWDDKDFEYVESEVAKKIVDKLNAYEEYEYWQFQATTDSDKSLIHVSVRKEIRSRTDLYFRMKRDGVDISSSTQWFKIADLETTTYPKGDEAVDGIWEKVLVKFLPTKRIPTILNWLETYVPLARDRVNVEPNCNCESHTLTLPLPVDSYRAMREYPFRVLYLKENDTLGIDLHCEGTGDQDTYLPHPDSAQASFDALEVKVSKFKRKRFGGKYKVLRDEPDTLYGLWKELEGYKTWEVYQAQLEIYPGNGDDNGTAD